MGNVALDLHNKIATVSNEYNVCYWKTISNDPYLLDCMLDHDYLKYYNVCYGTVEYHRVVFDKFIDFLEYTI